MIADHDAGVGLAAGGRDGGQEVGRVGLTGREAVAAADRGEEMGDAEAASSERAGASGLLVQTARRQPSAWARSRASATPGKRTDSSAAWAE